MSIRTKAILALATTQAALLAATYVFTTRVVMSSFANIEQEAARASTARAARGVREQLDSLATKAEDWATWDEMYEFVQNGNAPFRQRHVQPERAAELDLDVFVCAQPDGAVVSSFEYLRNTGKFIRPPDALAEMLVPGGQLSPSAKGDSMVKGVVKVDDRYLIVASRRITLSKGDGVSKGTLLLGRWLDDSRVNQLSLMMNIPISLEEYDASDPRLASAQALSIQAKHSPGWWAKPNATLCHVLDDTRLAGEVVMADMEGKPLFVLACNLPRPVYQQGQQTVRLILLAVGGACVLVTAFSFGLLSKMLLSPVMKLASEVDQIRGSSGGAAKVTITEHDEIGRLGRSINQLLADVAQANEHLRAADDAKSQFLANMSHEIRTPLNGVIGSLKLLRDTPLNEQQGRLTRTGETAAEAVLALINDILDLSKIEAKALEIESTDVDLGALLESVVELCAPKASEKKIGLEAWRHASIPSGLRGDPTRLRQVLLNLATNAVKFTAEGGVTIRADLEKVDGGSARVRFAVTDTGVGIPPDRLDRLFRSFSQVDASTTRKHGGTGLGLAISKRLVELMGGEIGVQSEPGKGSTFWFSVPLPFSRKPQQVVPQNSKDFRALRLLVVASEGPERALVEEFLNGMGVQASHSDQNQGVYQSIRREMDTARPFGGVIISTGGHYESTIGLIDRLRESSDTLGLLIVVIVDDPDALRAKFARPVVPAPIFRRRPIQDSDLGDALGEAMAGAWLPARATTAATASKGGSGATLKSGLHVLLVEDNEVNQTIALEILKTFGCDVRVAENGRMAVEAVASRRTDLILMDIQMPVMDGYEASREIRRLEERKPIHPDNQRHIPIIALTANALIGDREKCLEAGMSEYLTKPLDPAALRATISKLVPRALAPEPAPTPPQARVEPERASATSAEEADPAIMQAVDLSDLLARCSNNAEVSMRILKKFGGIVPRMAQTIQDAIDAGDLARVATEAHTLKGSAATIGARDVARAAARVEAGAKAGDRESVMLARGELRVRVDECVQCIRIHESKGMPSSSTGV